MKKFINPEIQIIEMNDDEIICTSGKILDGSFGYNGADNIQDFFD